MESGQADLEAEIENKRNEIKLLKKKIKQQ